MKYSWKTYNLKRINLSKKIIKFNRKNKFNYIENGLYNHIRDIFCIGLLLLDKKKKLNKILDYGSNLIALSNIKNKINTKKYKFYIFDPFCEKKINLKYPVNVTISNKKKFLKESNFDLINFGSSLQYLNSLDELKNNLNFFKTKVIVITHTPVTLKKSFKSSQKNHKNLIQKIYNYNSLISFFIKKKYKIIFKSINEKKYIGLKNNNKHTFSINIIFQR